MISLIQNSLGWTNVAKEFTSLLDNQTATSVVSSEGQETSRTGSKVHLNTDNS